MKRKMKVILAMVVSLNGKTTKGEIKSPTEWASSEDQLHFQSLVASNNLIVMGSKTYEASKAFIRLQKDKLRIVLTRNPGKFKDFSVLGQLEFSNESPDDIVKRLEKNGYRQILLASGANINTLFFQSKLIDEIWLTVEPRIFGLGKNLVEDANLDVQLSLESVKKLNKKGTLLLKYKVLN